MLKELMEKRADRLNKAREIGQEILAIERHIAEMECPFIVGQTVTRISTFWSSYNEGKIDEVVFSEIEPFWDVSVTLRDREGSLTCFKETWRGLNIETINLDH